MRHAYAAFVHTSFQHLLANMLLYASLGGLLELRYGSLRVAVVWLLSAIGSAFVAATFETDCTMVIHGFGGYEVRLACLGPNPVSDFHYGCKWPLSDVLKSYTVAYPEVRDIEQVVGASGAVLGFLGLAVADLVVNFGSLLFALARLAFIIAAACFFIVTAITKVCYSHLSFCLYSGEIRNYGKIS